MIDKQLAQNLESLRIMLIKQIRELVAPHMYESGYRKVLDPSRGVLGPTRALRLWAPAEPLEVQGFALIDLYAVTEDGLMTDATGGGALNEDFECFPLEDLITLLEVLRKELNPKAGEGEDASTASLGPVKGRVLFATSASGDVTVIEAGFDQGPAPAETELLAEVAAWVASRSIMPGQIWQWEGLFGRYKNGKARWSGKIRPMRVQFRFSARAA